MKEVKQCLHQAPFNEYWLIRPFGQRGKISQGAFLKYLPLQTSSFNHFNHLKLLCCGVAQLLGRMEYATRSVVQDIAALYNQISLQATNSLTHYS